MPEPWALSFPTLFKGIVDTARHIQRDKDHRIRIGDGDKVLQMCKSFFAADQTPHTCMQILDVCWGEERFVPCVYTIGPGHGHFELLFAGRTVELHIKSHSLLEDWTGDFCVDVHVRSRGTGTACCTVN